MSSLFTNISVFSFLSVVIALDKGNFFIVETQDVACVGLKTKFPHSYMTITLFAKIQLAPNL